MTKYCKYAKIYIDKYECTERLLPHCFKCEVLKFLFQLKIKILKLLLKIKRRFDVKLSKKQR